MKTKLGTAEADPDIDASLSVDEQNAYYDYTLNTDPQINKAVNAAMTLTGQN